ncbi:ISAs1 family transposase, partial [Aeromonas sp. PrichA-15]|nr:ISAs1 family transposase [Aeromonas sp. PrichA-15]
HYILDVVFNEDASRIAMEDAVENMALFRRFVLNIVKQSNCGARSQRNKGKCEQVSHEQKMKILVI